MPSDLSPTETNADFSPQPLATQLTGDPCPGDNSGPKTYSPDLWLNAQRDAYNRTMRQTALDAALKVVVLSPHVGHATHAKAVLETARRFHRFLTA